jgi:hypothetical protein
LSSQLKSSGRFELLNEQLEKPKPPSSGRVKPVKERNIVHMRLPFLANRMQEKYNFITNEKEMNNKVKAAGRGTAFPLKILTVALFTETS